MRWTSKRRLVTASDTPKVNEIPLASRPVLASRWTAWRSVPEEGADGVGERSFTIERSEEPLVLGEGVDAHRFLWTETSPADEGRRRGLYAVDGFGPVGNLLEEYTGGQVLRHDDMSRTRGPTGQEVT